MKTNNQYTQSAFDNNKKYALSTQEATNVDKSRVTGLLALAYNMGATNENAQKVVNTAIGLNKALGVDMERAIRGTILAMNGHTEQLARFIPELRGVKDGVFGLNQVLEFRWNPFVSQSARDHARQSEVLHHDLVSLVYGHRFPSYIR